MRQRITFRVGPFSVSGDPSAGARPASRRSNRAAALVLALILAAVLTCGAIGWAL